MESKDKLIGFSLIIIGILFIALGVWSMTMTAKKNNQVYSEKNNEVYTEQQFTENTVYSENMQNVEVYTETDSEESTRYIY